MLSASLAATGSVASGAATDGGSDPVGVGGCVIREGGTGGGDALDDPCKGKGPGGGEGGSRGDSGGDGGGGGRSGDGGGGRVDGVGGAGEGLNSDRVVGGLWAGCSGCAITNDGHSSGGRGGPAPARRAIAVGGGGDEAPCGVVGSGGRVLPGVSLISDVASAADFVSSQVLCGVVGMVALPGAAEGVIIPSMAGARGELGMAGASATDGPAVDPACGESGRF